MLDGLVCLLFILLVSCDAEGRRNKIALCSAICIAGPSVPYVRIITIFSDSDFHNPLCLIHNKAGYALGNTHLE